MSERTWRVAAYGLPVLGIAAVVSGWVCARPAEDSKYRRLLEREAASPGSVTAEEWIWNETPPAFLIVVVLFLVAAVTVAGVAAMGFASWADAEWRFRLQRRIAVAMGAAWLLLGGAFHAVIWLC